MNTPEQSHRRSMTDNFNSNSILSPTMTSNKHMESVLSQTGMFKDFDPLAVQRQLTMAQTKRPKPKTLFIEPESSDDETGGAFTANPAEDIPRNKLTEKLARGL